MQRQGSCHRCGHCCGVAHLDANNQPIQDSGWPSSWYPENRKPGWRNHRLEDLLARAPQAALFGVIQKGDGKLGPAQEVGAIRVTGHGGGMYYYVWVPGFGPCKDTSAAHDGSEYSLECPFLKDWDGSTLTPNGDPVRLCGLVGTNQDNCFRVRCENGGTPEELPERTALLRMFEYPDCGIWWE